MKDSEGEAIFVAWAGHDEQKQLYAYSVASGHLGPRQHVPWEATIVQGRKRGKYVCKKNSILSLVVLGVLQHECCCSAEYSTRR